MERAVLHPDWSQGPDACQGDLCITRLEPRHAGLLRRDQPIKSPIEGAVILLEGELTGHNHAIYALRNGPAMFRDDGLARDLTVGTVLESVPLDVPSAGAATLFRDDALMARLVSDDVFTRSDLCVGFLSVDGGLVVVKHPEHDGICLPEGVFYVGKQIESAGAEERAVRD